MEIFYSRRGDYLIPNLTLNEPPREQTEPLTKYGVMRRSYLKEHRAITYNQLLLTERLFPHLREVQQEAQARLDSLMADMLTFQPPLDKDADGIAWAAHMTEFRRIAERMMLDELIYT